MIIVRVFLKKAKQQFEQKTLWVRNMSFWKSMWLFVAIFVIYQFVKSRFQVVPDSMVWNIATALLFILIWLTYWSFSLKDKDAFIALIKALFIEMVAIFIYALLECFIY